MRVRLIGVAVVASAFACGGVSEAQIPAQDSVTGTAATGFGRSLVEFTFDVHSGPSGENPTGTVAFHGTLVDFGPLDISCVRVSDNDASMIVLAPEPNLFPPGIAVSVEDNGPGQDSIGWEPLAELPSDCPLPSGILGSTTISGDVTVTDALAHPTSKDQCEKGGWAQFGFNNRKQCVRSVRQRARQECVFIRAAHGRPAFRAQYGSGPHKRHAMRRCVRQRMND